jgi:hypothetical protein
LLNIGKSHPRQCKKDLEDLARHFVLDLSAEESGAIAARMASMERLLIARNPVADLIGCCLDLSLVPFEKVLCQMPFTFIRRDKDTAQEALDLWDEEDDHSIRYCIFTILNTLRP